MRALLANHKSDEAKKEVQNFLKANPNYPENLKNKILEAAWIMMAQEPYVEKAKPTVVRAPRKSSTKK